MEKSFIVKRTVVELFEVWAENGTQAIDKISNCMGPISVTVIKETAREKSDYQNGKPQHNNQKKS